MFNWIKKSEEVYYSLRKIPKISKKEINFLIEKSKMNKRKRCRLCTHKNEKDISHEMFIVHLKDCYIRPHKHQDKVESLSVIDGEADAIFFDDNGNITEKIQLGVFSSGKNFYYRIEKNIFHMLIIKSEYFIFHENTLGPFKNNTIIYPNWSPEQYDQSFIDKINHNSNK